jgi:hypothetical protein
MSVSENHCIDGDFINTLLFAQTSQRILHGLIVRSPQSSLRQHENAASEFSFQTPDFLNAGVLIIRFPVFEQQANPLDKPL